MRSDLDRVMVEQGLDAIAIPITENYSAALCSLAGRVRVGGGLALKKQGEAPVLVVFPMEAEEAAAGRATVYTLEDFEWSQLLQEMNGNYPQATARLWGRCLEKIGVASGKVGVYGVGDFEYILEFVPLLRATHPHYEFCGDLGPTLFDKVVVTKDADEIARIKSVARRTGEIWQATWDFLSSHRADGDTVVQKNGAPLTIGDVKRFVRRELLDRELEDTGMIFAQGRDGAIPHSRGQNDMPLRLGQAIVFDLFPQELGGGYHHDSTRTWCIGYAPEEVQRIYDTVLESFDVAVEAYALGKPTHMMQEVVQDYFESNGHPTARSHPGTTVGYTHGLGHGVGWSIHERPRINHISKDDQFAVGNVFTIEPGLYYPERGYGVRIEDTFYIDEEGSLISLTSFRKDLVLPLKSEQ